MSDSGSSNSWTILTPEETVAETLVPLAEGTEHQEDTATAQHAADPGGGAERQPEEGDACALADAASGAECQPVEGDASVASALTVEGHQVVETTTDEDTGPHAAPDADLTPSSVTDLPPPSSLEIPAPSFPDSDPHSQSEGLPEGPDLSSADPDSFSDSYTHISPTPEDPPASLLTTETLGQLDLTQEEEGLLHEGTPSSLNGEGLVQEEEEPELSQRMKQAAPDSPVDSKEVVEEKKETEGEPVVVRRRSSLLAALERVGRTAEDEEVEEEFHLPQREEESGFSVNKCILGAVILLGLGTIFFSGVFMDLDEEGDYGTKELRDAEVPVKQEWLNPDIPPPSADVDRAELLNKLTKGSQQITVMQAQLQAQKEELKVAAGQAAEGAKERLRREEVEKENANEAAPPPVTPTAPPPSGQSGDSSQDTTETTERRTKKPWEGEKVEIKKDWKKEKHDMGKKDWKEEGKAEWKEKEKDRKKGKYEQEREGKGWKQKEEEKKDWKERGEWKKEKASRGDEGKPWKDRDGKKEQKEKSERKEWKEDKEWKKGKHEKWDDHKERRSKEEKERKGGKEHGEWHKGKDEWKGEKDWRKGKGGHKESDKGWKEKKEWKDKGEKKEWKDKGEKKEWKDKGEKKEWKDKGEKKEWKEKGEKKEWKKEGEKKRDEWREGRKDGDWKRDKESSHKHKDKHDKYEKHQKEQLWQGAGHRKYSDKDRRPSVGQPEYWDDQREKLHHNKPQSSGRCDSVETCAQADGLHPVALPEFEAVLQRYLAKAEEAGVEAPRREELSKLAAEFFSSGVFVHDQMSFRDFAEDVGDILEDMVEGEEEDENEEDSAIEDEMEEFEKEVLMRFSVPGVGEKEEKKKGEWKKERGRGRG